MKPRLFSSQSDLLLARGALDTLCRHVEAAAGIRRVELPSEGIRWTVYPPPAVCIAAAHLLVQFAKKVPIDRADTMGAVDEMRPPGVFPLSATQSLNLRNLNQSQCDDVESASRALCTAIEGSPAMPAPRPYDARVVVCATARLVAIASAASDLRRGEVAELVGQLWNQTGDVEATRVWDRDRKLVAGWGGFRS